MLSVQLVEEGGGNHYFEQQRPWSEHSHSSGCHQTVTASYHH